MSVYYKLIPIVGIISLCGIYFIKTLYVNGANIDNSYKKQLVLNQPEVIPIENSDYVYIGNSYYYSTFTKITDGILKKIRHFSPLTKNYLKFMQVSGYFMGYLNDNDLSVIVIKESITKRLLKVAIENYSENIEVLNYPKEGELVFAIGSIQCDPENKFEIFSGCYILIDTTIPEHKIIFGDKLKDEIDTSKFNDFTFDEDEEFVKEKQLLNSINLVNRFRTSIANANKLLDKIEMNDYFNLQRTKKKSTVDPTPPKGSKIVLRDPKFERERVKISKRIISELKRQEKTISNLNILFKEYFDTFTCEKYDIMAKILEIILEDFEKLEQLSKNSPENTDIVDKTNTEL